MGCPEWLYNHIENTWTKADAREASLEWEDGFAKFLEDNPQYAAAQSQGYQQEMTEVLENIPSDPRQQAAMGLDSVPEDDFEGEFARWKVENYAA